MDTEFLIILVSELTARILIPVLIEQRSIRRHCQEEIVHEMMEAIPRLVGTRIVRDCVGPTVRVPTNGIHRMQSLVGSKGLYREERVMVVGSIGGRRRRRRNFVGKRPSLVAVEQCRHE